VFQPLFGRLSAHNLTKIPRTSKAAENTSVGKAMADFKGNPGTLYRYIFDLNSTKCEAQSEIAFPRRSVYTSLTAPLAGNVENSHLCRLHGKGCR
jgi:hypothetical protein